MAAAGSSRPHPKLTAPVRRTAVRRARMSRQAPPRLLRRPAIAGGSERERACTPRSAPRVLVQRSPRVHRLSGGFVDAPCGRQRQRRVS